LGKIWIPNVGDVDFFKVIFALLKIQINSQKKPSFEREKNKNSQHLFYIPFLFFILSHFWAISEQL